MLLLSQEYFMSKRLKVCTTLPHSRSIKQNKNLKEQMYQYTERSYWNGCDKFAKQMF